MKITLPALNFVMPGLFAETGFPGVWAPFRG